MDLSGVKVLGKSVNHTLVCVILKNASIMDNIGVFLELGGKLYQGEAFLTFLPLTLKI